MQKFTQKIVSMMKAEKLFQTQGGPIIMSQVTKTGILNKIFICIIDFSYLSNYCDKICIFFIIKFYAANYNNGNA